MAQGNPWGQPPGFGAAPVGQGYAHAHGGGHAGSLSMQRGLLIAMLPLHLLMFVIQCLSLSLQLITEGGGLLSAPTPFEQGEIVGRLLAGGCFLLWGAVGGVWAIINLTKLKNPGPSLRTSLTAYWWFSALSCLCFPFGIFGLVNLSRPDVRAALGAPLPHQARY